MDCYGRMPVPKMVGKPLDAKHPAPDMIAVKNVLPEGWKSGVETLVAGTFSNSFNLGVQILRAFAVAAIGVQRLL